MTDMHTQADELADAVRYEQLCRLTRPTTAAEADELERQLALAVSRTRVSKKLDSKHCAHCQGELPNRRLTYHPECREPARMAAQLSRRRCSKCRRTRAASKFANDATRHDGKFPWCVDCQTAGAKRFQDSEAEPNGHACPVCDTQIRGHKNRRYCSAKCRGRANSLSKRFGLAIEQYRALVAATGGYCPLCQCRPRVWAVDHNHRTGRVTGVVCTGCNVQLLAASRHDIARAQALLRYLTSTPADRLGIVAIAPEGVHKPSQIHKMWQHRAVSA